MMTQNRPLSEFSDRSPLSLRMGVLGLDHGCVSYDPGIFLAPSLDFLRIVYNV
jgi:hypothetical protein